MQIVIDIPEEKYQGIINMAEEILDASTFCSPRYLYKVVLNGTPLPKGHGRLIDVSDIEWARHQEERNYIDYDVIDWDDIVNAPTIIEAARAEGSEADGGTQHE